MAHQSPMISIPKKTTDEVDWTTPIRNLIAQSYGESPDTYAAECAALQRCRQDAVRGAGSDLTARDLLYKYFGQLELLELRFAEIRVTFPWHDAFTHKLTTQTSIAFEKASILFQIAATHSSIAAAQNRSDPEGVKRAFYSLRTCAGMLTYINENFLHAPSTDLSRDVVKLLINLILAQATEVFFEKVTNEKKGSPLVAKIGAQAAAMYNSLVEEVKEFMGKGIFDRHWVTLIQIKAKYFTSLSQYYRGQADITAGRYGDGLVRFTLAETLAKEASRLAAIFSGAFVSNVSPTLPADAGTSISDRLKAHLAVCSERKGEAQRENDLIYNAVLPNADALPMIDQAKVATPIPIHEVYGAPDVQKVIGPDMFLKLIPLSVHESASVYSEEKAKLVRREVEAAEAAEGEVRSALDGLGVQSGLARFKAMVEGSIGAEEEVPLQVRRWKDDIAVIEEREGVDMILGQLNKLKESVRRDLDSVSRDLEIESKDCEMMRVRYDHLWTQPPSAGFTKGLRQDLKSHYSALDAAAASDSQVVSMWETVKGDIRLLLSPAIEDVFRASTENSGVAESLLDLDIGGETDDAEERSRISGYVDEIEERLGRLNKISHERNEVLKELKEKVQTDDVSHLLLINRRNTGVEPTLFASELEKFRPYQQRLAATSHHQQVAIKEISSLWKGLKDIAGRGAGARKWDEREKRKKDTVRRFSHARDIYNEVKDGLTKGMQFYNELTELTAALRRNARSYVSGRTSEREKLVAQAEKEKQLSNTPSAPPPLAAKPTSLDSQFSAMNMRSPPPPGPAAQSPYAPQQQSYSSPQQFSTPPPSQYQSIPLQYQQSQQQQQQQQQQQPAHAPYLPPPPLPPSQPSYSSFSSTPSAPAADPYASLESFNPGQYSSPPPMVIPNNNNNNQQYPSYNNNAAAPQQQQYNTSYQQPGQGFPPPPPPVSYHSSPPPNQYQQQQPPPPHNQYQPFQQQGYQNQNQNTGYGR